MKPRSGRFDPYGVHLSRSEKRSAAEEVPDSGQQSDQSGPLSEEPSDGSSPRHLEQPKEQSEEQAGQPDDDTDYDSTTDTLQHVDQVTHFNKPLIN